MSGGLGKSVCVVGAGAIGLVTTKNLLEEGFDVTTYEQNDYVGGLWRFNPDVTKPSVLEKSKANFSKHGACFSDFPYGDDAALHPTAVQTLAYLERYADHFGLKQHVQFSTRVKAVARDEKARKWIVAIHAEGRASDSQTHVFDRLVIATGPQGRPNMLKFSGSERFMGELIHSQQFKDPSKYEGKTVIVLGTAASAGDTIEFIRQAGAAKIYMSHRRSPRLLPRVKDGKAVDVGLTRRLALMTSRIRATSPAMAEKMGANVLGKMQKDVWPELANNPAFAESRGIGSTSATLPLVSDDLAKNLLDGSVESVQAIDYISGSRSVMLKDGTELGNIDAIVCCTGSMLDYKALLPPEYDPTNPELAPDRYSALRSAEYYKEDILVARLYRRFLSVQEPHSLAFLGNALYRRSAFALYDLISMALAQLWKGDFPMPSRSDMDQECDRHYRWLISELELGDVGLTGLTNDMDFDLWLQKAAGCGVWERLGWDRQGWSLWWRDRKLYSLLMDGVDSPHALRLFETERGRKSWPGARAAIEKANREVQEGAEKWKREQAPQRSK